MSVRKCGDHNTGQTARAHRFLLEIITPDEHHHALTIRSQPDARLQSKKEAFGDVRERFVSWAEFVSAGGVVS